MQSCDLLVTAMALPGQDGAALAARLRAEQPDLPVIFLVIGPPGPALAGELVLQQPVEATALAGSVLDLLKRRRSLRAPPPAVRLLGRLRTPSLRAAYLSWHAARLPGDALPRLAGFDLATLDLQDHAILLAVDAAGSDAAFRFVSAGAAITVRLGRPLSGTPAEALELASDTPGSMMAAYRRCLRTTAPIFESARFDLGDGPALRFERLMLPLSEDGRRVTHLVGVVLFHDEATAAAGGP